MLRAGAILTLEIEKAVAGGRMLARSDGQVILVSGAIPGERVIAEVEPSPSRVAFARTKRVLNPHHSRRRAPGDPACGGNVYAHIECATQRRLKADILVDAFSRIAHHAIPDPVPIEPSPESGYRMRARLHAAGGLLGFLREGTHDLCDPRSTDQLLPAMLEAIDRLALRCGKEVLRAVTAIEIVENIEASERSAHIETTTPATRSTLAAVRPVEGITGLSVSMIGEPGLLRAYGQTSVSDEIDLWPDQPGEASRRIRLSRQTRAFFQSNRFLLTTLIQRVLARVPSGAVIDLYAGVGLFAVALAASGRNPVLAIEGNSVSARDLARNAQPYRGQLTVLHSSVEAGIARARPANATVLVDPPRTGLSSEVVRRLGLFSPPVIVYVSCDPATLARDVGALVDRGYRMEDIEGFDLFPNTAHVEALVVLKRT